MNRTILLFSAFCFLLVTSCKTRHKTSEINYMQNVEALAAEAAMKTAASTIQKGDILQAFVSAKDMEVVRPFNQSYYSQSAASPTGSSSAAVERQYLVSSEGTIDFPVLGVLQTEGKTVEAFKAELTQRISAYVKSPNVSLKLVNFKVTVLGEVARPGQYTIPEGQSTLLNAIGLAGDLTIYGKRDDILMVRSENGSITKERINLMDADFINSPFFQLKQGDVIYVSANQTKDKVSRLDPNTGTYIAIAGTVIGLAGIFITIFKN
ncbi:polysaccharide biosynthesis/export family protein [Chryseobacterium sp.]|uniref:polysaccharide biosynthesis/export family protein n=1 Tax=Chryseobacterium sp. TaxID=1871047 RepID=UPI001E606728|nr:polysaccharide biosynthesis/export family protein [Chryseobacterium sp.]